MIKFIRATLIFICLIIMAEITQMYFNTHANVPFLFGWFACLIINWEKIIKQQEETDKILSKNGQNRP